MEEITQGKFYNSDLVNINAAAGHEYDDYKESYEGAAVFGGKVKYAGAQTGDQKFIVDAVDIDWNGYSLRKARKNNVKEAITSTGEVIEEISYLQSGVSDLANQLRLITGGGDQIGDLTEMANAIQQIWDELSTNTNTDFSSLLDYLRAASSNVGGNSGSLVNVSVTPDEHGLGVSSVTVDESALSSRLSTIDTELSYISDTVDAISSGIPELQFSYEANTEDPNEPGALLVTINYL